MPKPNPYEGTFKVIMKGHTNTEEMMAVNTYHFYEGIFDLCRIGSIDVDVSNLELVPPF